MMMPTNDAATRASAVRLPHLPACRGFRACSWQSGTGRRRSGSGRGPRSRCRSTTNHGVVSRITQVIDHSSAIRMNIASDRPIFRARARSSRRSFPARIEMKTMLSMPRTISSTVSVARAIHPSALLVHPNAPDSQPDINAATSARARGSQGGQPGRPTSRGPARPAWRDTARRLRVDRTRQASGRRRRACRPAAPSGPRRR